MIVSHVLWKMYSNGEATVECGLVVLICFSWKGDTVVTTVESLLGYGEDSQQKQHLVAVVFVNRGYNVAERNEKSKPRYSSFWLSVFLLFVLAQ
jgi:hypothetical protein